MADGSIFVAGGTLLVSLYEAATETTANWIYGMPNVTRYSFATGTWSRGEDMRGLGASGSNLRWYGTVTRLADQRMLISSGYTLAMLQVIPRPPQAPQHHLGVKNLSIEVMLPAGGGKVVSTHQQTPEEVWNPDYTHAFQVPYGPPLVPPNMVLMFGEAGVPVYFFPDNPQGARWFTQSDARRPGATTSAGAPNHGAASVMLPMRALNGEWGYMNGSILQAGGGKESDMEKSIDFYEIGSSGWGQSLNLGVPRRYPATVLLPDGKVMVISGYDRTYQNPFLRNAHYLDMRPPLSPDTFTTGTAASGETRGYHNVALLLPDGRVLIAGGRSKGSDLDRPVRREAELPLSLSAVPLADRLAASAADDQRRARHHRLRLELHAPGLRRPGERGGAHGPGLDDARVRHEPALRAARGDAARHDRRAGHWAGQHRDRAAGVLHALRAQPGSHPVDREVRPSCPVTKAAREYLPQATRRAPCRGSPPNGWWPCLRRILRRRAPRRRLCLPGDRSPHPEGSS